jgi:hypothetical protein
MLKQSSSGCDPLRTLSSWTTILSSAMSNGSATPEGSDATMTKAGATRRLPFRLAGLLVLIGLLLGTAYVTSYFARLPESNCSTSPISEAWAEDHAYKATLLEKQCNKWETIFYSVRVDAYSPPLRRAWFTIEQVEDDERPVAPVVRWEMRRALLIEMQTRTLSGTIQRHVGDDLTIVRRFQAREPNAFPNN